MSNLGDKEFVDLIGFEDRYKIRMDGLIFRKERDAHYKHINKPCIRKLKEKKIAHQKNQNGYPSVVLTKNGKYHAFLIHRLIALHFLPPPTKDIIDECKSSGVKSVFINHKDGDICNFDISNLEWCTPSHNTSHAYKTGLMKKDFGKASSRFKHIVVAEDRNGCGLVMFGRKQITESGFEQSAVYKRIKRGGGFHRGFYFSAIPKSICFIEMNEDK